MSESLAFTNFLEALTRLHPAETLLHIGEGRRNVSKFVKSISPKYILTTIGNCINKEKSGLSFQWPETYQPIKAVIGSETGEANFYVASLPNESGLINPERLTQIWQNIATNEILPVMTESLFDFFNREDVSKKASSVNWLSVDCLSSGNIIMSSLNIMEQFDVIIVRTVIAQNLADQTYDFSKTAIEDALHSKAFQFAGIYPEMNAAIGQAVLVRNYKKMFQGASLQVQKLQSKTSSLSVQVKERDSVIANLNDVIKEKVVKETTTLEKSKSYQNQIDDMLKENHTLKAKLQSNDVLQSNYFKILTEHKSVAANLRAHIDELSKTINHKSKELGDIQNEREIVESDLNTQLENAVKLIKEKNEELKLLQKDQEDYANTFERLEADKNRAEQKLLINMNNTQDLREQYKSVAKTLKNQTALMSNVLSLLNELEALSLSKIDK